MAEAVVSFVLTNLNSLLVQEVKLLASVEQQVKDIINELERIRAFLKDADARAAAEEEEEGGGGKSSEGVKIWVKQVREKAYHIEDVIDEYILKLAQLVRRSGFFGWIQNIFGSVKKLKLQHEVVSEIENIKKSLAEIHQSAQSFKFGHVDQESSSRKKNAHDSGVSSYFIEEAEVMGMESTRDKLIDWLVNGRSQRSLMALVGEGGLGKTTIAGKVFNNEGVKNHFDCRAWLTVGKDYNKRDLLKTIIKKFHRLIGQSPPAEIYNMDEEELITTLREHLNDKSYLVVFDDVWKIDFWADVERALLDNNRGSRIMITTRRMNIADFCRQSAFVQVLELKTLSPDEAWSLFCLKAFGSRFEGCCPPELEGLSREIVAKCGGLPLAIVAVGGLLSTKRQVASEWKKLLNGLGSKLGSDLHLKDCNRVLSQGYYDLPHHLKLCLLYFGLFPEGHKIKCGKLMRLWIAEGFVQYSTIPPSEQVAEEYLTELIDRSLVQVLERDISGRPRRCRVHDLMYEVIIKKTKELGFRHVMNEEKSNEGKSNDPSKTRRISIYGNNDGASAKSINNSKVRTILFFNVDEVDSFMNTIVADFMLVKVLDLENAQLRSLPEEIGKLFHLHYLSLRNTRVQLIPKSIGKLLNLETLDLQGSLVTGLPMEVMYLKRLRYLKVCRSNYEDGARVSGDFGSLTDLQKLCYVEANSEVLVELGKLKQLRKLGIRLTNGNGQDLCASIAKMGSLESLNVGWKSGGQILDIQLLDSPPPYLQHLFLAGNMKKLPAWIFKLQNLIRICLDSSGLRDDPMSVLQALPNLLEIRLINTYNYEHVHFKEGWFPKLQMLSLLDLETLKLVIIEKGAMPNLRDLRIGPCPRLTEIPTGIEHLRNLKFLNFKEMLTQVYLMTNEEKWKKFTRHIPEIRVSFQKAGKIYYCTANYLSSLSAEDFKQFTEELDQNNELA